MNLPKFAVVVLALMSAILLSGCASKPAPRGIAGVTVPQEPGLIALQAPEAADAPGSPANS